MPRSRARSPSKYRNAGQTCVCANRILVQDGVYDAFAEALAETAGAMKVADGFEPGAVHRAADRHEGGREGRGAHRREDRGREKHPVSLRGAQRRSNLGRSWARRLWDCLASLAMTLVTTDMVITKEETFAQSAPLYPRIRDRRHQRGHYLAETPGEIAGFGGSNRPPAFSLVGALKRPIFPSPRCRSHIRRPPMHLLGW